MPVFAFGSNSHSQLGTVSDDVIIPSIISLPRCLQITGGSNFSLIISVNGDVFLSGSLFLRNHNAFTKLPFNGMHFVYASCGWDHVILLTNRGDVYSIGDIKYAGIASDIANKDLSLHETSLTNITRLSSGYRHNLAIDRDGNLFGFGQNKYGELGALQSPSPPSKHTDIISNPRHIPIPAKAIDMACGKHHSIILLENGEIHMLGYNKFGVLGCSNGNYKNKNYNIILIPDQTPIRVFAGWGFSGVLCESGYVYQWGRNDHGQLGSSSSSNEPYKVNFNPTLVTTRIKEITSVTENVIAIDFDDRYWCWGWNEHGNCGTGNCEDVIIPTSVDFGQVQLMGCGYGHSFVISKD